MANEQTLISGIEYKIRKLIELSQMLKKENKELHQHIDVLTKRVGTLTNELEEKRNELLKISLAKTLEKKYGVEETKTKIDDLILEIEKSIEILSDQDNL
ncbi:MAG TPA: hypothetical protein ENH02_03025 [Bacteroidetes bacterium]|nr:hypothetical protein [Bacteroidota bacterium]